MKIIAVIVIAFACSPSIAEVSIGKCSDALQFDTTTLESNSIAALSLFNSISESEFEDTKKKGGLNVVDLFSGTYSEGRKRAREYSSLLQQRSINISTDKFLNHTLSKDGARAYAECIRAATDSPVSAWIENARVKNPIVVKVRLGTAWTEGTISVSGATPETFNDKLQGGGSETTIRFEHPLNRTFSVTITLKNSKTEQTRTVSLERDVYRSVKIERTTRTEEGWVSCAAGCHGNTAGCAQSVPYTFSAGSGEWYESDKPVMNVARAELLGGPGIHLERNVFIQTSQIENDSSGRIIGVTGTPMQCEGYSPNTQSTVKFPITLRKSTWVAIEK